MLKCLAAASRRNLHCATSEGDSRNLGREQQSSSCCELLLTKFGTTEAAVIKEIFKQRIQDRVMQRQGGSSIGFIWNEFLNEFRNENWNEITVKKVPLQFCQGSPYTIGTKNATKIGMSWSSCICSFKS